MARIKFPTTFNEWISLFRKVKPKVLALPLPNPIDNFTTEDGISLAADDTAVNNAEAANNLFDAKEKESEELTEKARNLFAPVWADHKKCVQFLKKLYRSAVHKLGDWGVTVDGNGRVNYPSDFAGRKKCVTDLFAKHATYPVGTSPLQPFLDEQVIVPANNLTAATNAAAALASYDTASKLKEQKREERDNLITPVIGHLRGIGAVTVAWYSSAPRKAGSIGFEIDESPQGYKTKLLNIKPGKTKLVHDVLLDSVVTNKGSGSLLFRKGHAIINPPIVLAPGQSMFLGKGYSTFSIENDSLDKSGSVELTVRK